MTLPRILAVLLLTVGCAQSQPTNFSAAAPSGNAGIYANIAIPPLKELLTELAPKAKVSEERDGSATHFMCAWPDVTVRFTVISNWDGSAQRSAMKGWVMDLAIVQTNMPGAKPLLKKIDSTVACVGSIITPRCDPEGKAASVILALAAKLDGYVFADQAFYETDGREILGVATAPLRFKEQK